MTPREPLEAELIMPCPWCGEEGYDAVYMDEGGVSRHTICRNDVRTETIERLRASNLHSGIGEEGLRPVLINARGYIEHVGEHPAKAALLASIDAALAADKDSPMVAAVRAVRQIKEPEKPKRYEDLYPADKDSQPARDGLRRDIPRVKEGDPNARLPYFDVATLLGGATADTPTEPEPLNVERLAAAIWKVYPFPGSKPVRADIERIAAEYAALSATTETHLPGGENLALCGAEIGDICSACMKIDEELLNGGSA